MTELPRFQTAEDVLAAMRAYQTPCVLAAAVDLDVFNQLAGGPAASSELARRLGCDPRACAMLLDALAALGLLEKRDGRYQLPARLAPVLADGPQSAAPMLRHQANCLRRWATLPWVVQRGERIDPGPSLRGAEADRESFVEAMNVVSAPVAERLVREVHPGDFSKLLDVGGATGTWTIAWLRTAPQARAVLVDLPAVMPLARRRLETEGLADRVELVAADYLNDPLPGGADLAWVSAIIHQHSRDENRSLFRRLADALAPGGRILIRDVVMAPSRIEPLSGALFAINMLVGTDRGGTYTLEEIAEDLEAARFRDVRLVRRDPAMNSVVAAQR